MAFSIGLPFFMLMKVLTPAFFARKDTKTPMYVALISLLLNASLNYLLAFVLGYGHVGLAIGSSIAALVSVIILEIILYKGGFIQIRGLFNKFNFIILLSSIFLIVFLNFYTTKTNFIEFNQIERLVYLSIEISVSIFIYFLIARFLNGEPLRTLFN